MCEKVLFVNHELTFFWGSVKCEMAVEQRQITFHEGKNTDLCSVSDWLLLAREKFTSGQPLFPEGDRLIEVCLYLVSPVSF